MAYSAAAASRSVPRLSLPWQKILIFALVLSLYVPIEFPLPNLNLNLHDVFFALLTFGFLLYIFVSQRGQLKIFDKRVLLPIFGLLAYGILQLPFVVSPPRVVFEMIQLLQVVILALVLSGDNYAKFTQRDIHILLRVIFLISLIGAINASVYAVMTGNRFTGVQSVWFAFGSITYGFYYSLFHAVLGRRYFMYGALAVFAAAIALSETRSLWINIPVSLIVMLVAYRDIRRPLIKHGTVLLLAFLMFIASVGVPNDLAARFESIFTGEEMLLGRVYRWIAHANVFLDHPLGVGLGNGRYHILSYIPESSPELGKAREAASGGIDGPVYSAHSDWFGLLSQTGVIGVVLYGGLWLIVLKDVLFRRVWSPEALTLAAILILSFGGTFTSGKLLSGGWLGIMVYYWAFKRTVTMDQQTVTGSDDGERLCVS